NSDFKDYGKIENYPRRFLSEYDTRHPDHDAVVIRTEWEMDDGDVAAIEAELGEGVVTGKTVTIEKSYEDDGTTWSVPVDEEKVLDGLVKRFSLNKEERGGLGGAKFTSRAVSALEALSERTERQNE